MLDVLKDKGSLVTTCSVLQHIEGQYQELRLILDALVTAYPQQLQADWFTWESYLWAVQLWYAYAMQVSLQQPATAIYTLNCPCLSQHAC